MRRSVYSILGKPVLCLAAVLLVPAVGQGGKVVVDVGEQIVVPTREVVTPHIPWMNPRQGSELRVLFMDRREKMREVIEFAQRLEMDYAFWASGGSHDIDPKSEVFGTTYLRGGWYKGDEPGDKEKRLRRLLQGPDYDLIVIGAWLDWRKLPLFAKYEILEQVKNGAGLFSIGKGGYADEYLQSATKKRIEVPLSVAAGVPWQALPVFGRYDSVQAFLKSTLSASEFGRGRIVRIEGYGVTYRHMVSPGFTARPLESTGAWAQHWNSRTEEYKKDFPEFGMPILDIRRLDYDYNLAFLIKIMLFAAQKEPVVTVWGACPSPSSAPLRREGTASPAGPMETGCPQPACPGALGLIHEVDRDILTNITFTVTAPETSELHFLIADFALRDRLNRIHTTSSKDRIALTAGRNEISFPVSNLPAGEYFADLWIKDSGSGLGFGSQAIRVTSPTCIKSLAPNRDNYKVADSIGFTVGIDKGERTLTALRLVIRQTDTHGRLVRESSFSIPHSTFSIALPPIPHALTVYQFLDVDLVAGDQVLDRQRTLFSFSDLTITDTIRIGAWQKMQVSYIGWHLYDRLYELGFDYVGSFGLHHLWNYYGVGPNSSFKMGRHEIPVLSNLRFVPQIARITDGGMRDYADKTFLDVVRKQPLRYERGQRHPCLNEPRYNELMEKRVRDVVEFHKKLSSTQYMFNQEMCFTQIGNRKDKDDTDLCYSPWCKKYFRDYLRKQYGKIESLNAEYESAYKDFGEVEPVKLAEAAKDRRLWPLWADFRMAMESNYADFFTRLTKTMQSIQPEARTGDDWALGTGFRSLDGHDMWKMSRWQKITQPKPHGAINQLWVDFLRGPDSLVGFGAYWGPASGRGAVFSRYMPWNELFRGCNYFYTYWGDTGATLPAHDLSAYEDLKVLVQEYRELKGGIGKMIHEAERDHSGVALLYSMAGIHYWQLSHSEVTGGRDYYRGGLQQQYRAWTAMLTDAVGPFRFVSYEQLAAGKLEGQGVKLLVLPWSQALSPEEIEQVKVFVKNGGTVLADIRPGVSDGHCKAYKTSPLDEVFGVSQKTEDMALGSAWVKIPFGKHAAPAHFGRMKTDLSLRLAGGEAAGTAGDSTPALISHSYGKGKAILLNFSLDGYVLAGVYTIPRTVHAPKILAFVKPLIQSCGVRRPVGFSPDLAGLHCYPSHLGNLRYLALMQDLPEPLANYAAGIAKPLVTKKTAITLEKPAHVYESRAKRYLGQSDRVVTYVTPGIGKVLALLPYRLRSLEVKAPSEVKQGDDLPYEITLDATEPPEKHVLHIALISPDGKAIRWYTKNLACTGGRYAGELTLALNEKPGAYELSVTDAATGIEGRAGVRITTRDL